MGATPGRRVRLGVMVPSLDVIVVAVRPPVALSSISSRIDSVGLVAAPWTSPVGVEGLVGVRVGRVKKW